MPLSDITLFGCQSAQYCSEDTAPQNDIPLLAGSIGVLLILYLAQLYVLSYNTHSYIIGQKRYKVFHLSYFYILAIIIVVCRIVFFAVILQFLYHVKGKTEPPPQYVDSLDNFATYFELSLGIQQLLSIVELRLMLQYSCLFKNNGLVEAQRKQQEIFKNLLRYRYCSILASLAVLVLCSILTLAIKSEFTTNNP